MRRIGALRRYTRRSVGGCGGDTPLPLTSIFPHLEREGNGDRYAHSDVFSLPCNYPAHILCATSSYSGARTPANAVSSSYAACAYRP